MSGLCGGVEATRVLNSGGVIAVAVAPAEAVMMSVGVAEGSTARTGAVASSMPGELSSMGENSLLLWTLSVRKG